MVSPVAFSGGAADYPQLVSMLRSKSDGNRLKATNQFRYFLRGCMLTILMLF